jgi:hypothetical protein
VRRNIAENNESDGRKTDYSHGKTLKRKGLYKLEPSFLVKREWIYTKKGISVPPGKKMEV